MELFIFVAGMIVGVIAHIAWLSYQLRRLMQQLPELQGLLEKASNEPSAAPSAVNPDTRPRLLLRAELIGDMYYTYRVDDGTFVAQASGLTELNARIAGRYPGCAAVVTEGDDNVLAAMREQLKTSKKFK
jgi:hypothetical protein